MCRLFRRWQNGLTEALCLTQDGEACLIAGVAGVPLDYVDGVPRDDREDRGGYDSVVSMSVHVELLSLLAHRTQLRAISIRSDRICS